MFPHGIYLCRYWTPEPKDDKIEALAVPVALMQALQFHGSSLALCSLVFSLLMPLRVNAASLPARSHSVFLHWMHLFCHAQRLLHPLCQACYAIVRQSTPHSCKCTWCTPLCGLAVCAVDRQHPASQLDPPSCGGQGPSLQLHSLCTDGAAWLQHGGVGDESGAVGTAPQAEDGRLLGGGQRCAGPR